MSKKARFLESVHQHPSPAPDRRPADSIRSTRRRTKVLFLAPTYRQAEFWAREWGFNPPDWRYVRTENDLRGLSAQSIYVCGSPNWDTCDIPVFREMVAYLRVMGFTLIDAQDIDAIERRRVGYFNQIVAEGS